MTNPNWNGDDDRNGESEWRGGRRWAEQPQSEGPYGRQGGYPVPGTGPVSGSNLGGYGPQDGFRSGSTHWNPGSFSGQTPNYETGRGGPFVGKGPKGYRRSDERIREDVCDCLTECGSVDASDVDVAVADGEVTLSGSVADRRQKRAVEELCENCTGVKDVHNGLRVKGVGELQKSSFSREFEISSSNSPTTSPSTSNPSKSSRMSETSRR